MSALRDPSLYGLLYTSTSDGISPAGLDVLFQTARERNAGLDVTGALVVVNPSSPGEAPHQRFAHWLEGSKEAVYAAFDAITTDEGQASLVVTWKGPRSRRLCRGWSMALRYRPVASMVAALDELGLVLDSHLGSGASPAEVDDLILNAAIATAA